MVVRWWCDGDATVVQTVTHTVVQMVMPGW